jgi:hypothetical protein
MITQELTELFFDATKVVDNTQSPTKYRVRGFPTGPSSFTDYSNYKIDFKFASYKDVIAGGLLRCKLLFKKAYNNLEIHKLNYGRDKQWFNCEIIAKDNSVKIDGEDHFPYLSVSYSYDAVTAIKYEIGIYRTKCINGLLLGFKSLLKLKATPETIFDVELFFNPCLLSTLMKEYERNVMMLKSTKMKRSEILHLVGAATGVNIINDENKIARAADSNFIDEFKIQGLIDRYIDELGSNAYSALNVITDLGSNYRLGKEVELEISDSNNNVTTKQRLAGKWLDEMIRFIEQQNKIEMIKDIDSELFGEKPKLEKYDFDLEAYLRFKKYEN